MIGDMFFSRKPSHPNKASLERMEERENNSSKAPKRYTSLIEILRILNKTLFLSSS